MISTVVFDIGMVLVYFCWRELFAELGFEGEKFEKIAQATVHNPWWNEFDKGGMTIEEEVDGEIMSYRERMIKPDREIYELLCNRFNINPSEAVFLDDNAANVKGAKEFGLHAIHFKNYEQAKEELERYLAE